MARSCDVCSHPQLAQIDTDLALDLGYAAVSKKYNGDFSEDSAAHHYKEHLAASLARHMAVMTRSEAFMAKSENLTSIMYKFAELVAHAEEVRDRALKSGNDKMLLAANAEARATLFGMAKLYQTGQANASAHSGEELEASRALTRALRIVLPAHPEAERSLITELEAQGQYALASELTSYLRGN